MQIILIAGKAGSGKTTLGDLLVSEFNRLGKKTLRTEYSKYLKGYAKEILNYQGEEPKPRKFLQDTGSFLRSLDEHVFTRRMLEDLKVYEQYFDIVIISDVRLKREITDLEIKYPDILKIKVVNPRSSSLTIEEQNHITEKELENEEDFDYIISNQDFQTLEYYAKRIGEVIK